MKFSSAQQRSLLVRLLRLLATASLLVALLPSGSANASDAQPRTKRPVVHTDPDAPVEYPDRVWAGGPGRKGRFFFTNRGDESVTAYRVRIDGQWYGTVGADPRDPRGTSTMITFVPEEAGPARLTVEALGAGGWSESQDHTILVQGPTRIGRWPIDEGSGDTARDTSGREKHLLLDEGVAWIDGFEPGSALLFDGSGQLARAPRGAVVADRAYTVTGWVRLDEAEEVANQTVLAWGDRTGRAAIGVGHGAICDGGRSCFVASLTAEDGTSATAAVPGVEPEHGTWYFLALTYDGREVGSELGAHACTGPFDPVISGWSSSAPVRRERSPLWVGGDPRPGGPVDAWSGVVEQIDVFDRFLDADALATWCLGGASDGSSPRT